MESVFFSIFNVNLDVLPASLQYLSLKVSQLYLLLKGYLYLFTRQVYII